MASLPRVFQRVGSCVALLSLMALSLPAAAATFSVTEQDCKATPGGYQWAIEQANATLGHDTISIDVASFSVDSCDHPDATYRLPIAITESVDILGNGNRVAGNVLWADPNGFLNPNGQCPESLGSWMNFGGSLVDVGFRGMDSSGIDVTIRDLRMNGLVTVGYCAAQCLADNRRIGTPRDLQHVRKLRGISDPRSVWRRRDTETILRSIAAACRHFQHLRTLSR